MLEEKKDAVSIETILSDDQYVVPIYQRNYEWETEQIFKLILDIYYSENNYYLGTLVTYQNLESKFELIDGQQRHTTLNLIKFFLKEKLENELKEHNNFEKCFEKSNLHFQARNECANFFKQLQTGTINLPENFKSKNLLDGLNIIKDVFQEKQIDIVKFSEKFFRKTFIFRTELPKHTNLNHYFEIMNNRGEQLEKHEILKAQLMETLPNDELKSELFSQIWDACSNMGDYIWNNFDKNYALKIFDQDYSNYTLDELLTNLSFPISENVNNEKDNVDLDRLLDTHPIPSNFSQTDQEKTAKFRSVIDFPDLLIYTFNLQIKKTDEGSYDDKKLLEIFKDYADSEIFIAELLKTRIYFDKYVIKQMLNVDEKDQNWGIRSFEIKDKSFQINETAFDKNDEDDIEVTIEMLQAMFYFSSISDEKKDWLCDILKAQSNNHQNIFNILKKRFFEKIENLNVGNLKYNENHTTAKVFYYFEYMLWETYHKFLKSDKKLEIPDSLQPIIKKIEKEKFKNYKFRQLSSKEHLLPQSKANEIEKSVLNDFGNLCLISSAQNSSANDDHPQYKKVNFGKDNSSLKRLIMFNTYSGEFYTKQNIETHENEMKNLLEYYSAK